MHFARTLGVGIGWTRVSRWRLALWQENPNPWSANNQRLEKLSAETPAGAYGIHRLIVSHVTCMTCNGVKTEWFHVRLGALALDRRAAVVAATLNGGSRAQMQNCGLAFNPHL